MRRILVASILGIIALVASAAHAQGGRHYDPNTVATVSGTVAQVKTFEGRNGHGIHVTLTTADGAIDVHLGPEWYLKQQKTQVGTGDKVSVTGSRITFDDKPAIIAAEITKGSETLKLRDVKSGIPYWSRRGGR
jgi:hypothetical protein